MLTPHIPMPTGVLGPVGPALYLFLFSLFAVYIALVGKIPKIFGTRYVYLFILFSLGLIIADFFNFFRHDPSIELKYFLVRLTNLAVFVVFVFCLNHRIPKGGHDIASSKFLRTFYWSVIILSVVLLVQSFGIIDFGTYFRSRTFFGIKLPFYKPLGFFELSDGKLGMVVVSGFILALTTSVKKLRFIKTPFPRVLTFLFLITIIVLQSRSTYLGLAIAICFYICLYPLRRLQITGISFLIAGIFLLSLSGIGLKLWTGLKGEGIYEKNVVTRADIIDRDLKAWMMNPIFGNANRGARNLLNVPELAGSHNLFTNHLAVGGVVSFSLLMSMFILFINKTWRAYTISISTNDIRFAAFALWLMCSMIHAIVELSFYRGLYNEYLYFLFACGSLFEYKRGRK